MVKAVLEFPVGTLLDKYAGEKDDYLFLMSDILLLLLFLLDIFLQYILGIFIIAVFLWTRNGNGYFCGAAIFTKKNDKGKEASEWSLITLF
jgi:hypothetical protein